MDSPTSTWRPTTVDEDFDALVTRNRDRMKEDFRRQKETNDDVILTRQNAKWYYVIEGYADLARRMAQHGNAVYVSPDCPDILGAHEYMSKDVEYIEDRMREAG